MFRTMETELNAIKTSVNGILTTQKSGLSASEIEDFYKTLLGVELPYRKFNCKNAEEFVLKYMLSVATCRNVGGKMTFMPIIMDEAKHVASLVSRTKPKKVVAYNFKLKHTTPHLKKPTKYIPKQQKFVTETGQCSSSHLKPSFNTNGLPQAAYKMSSQYNYNYNNNNNNNFPGSSGLTKKHFESSGAYPQTFDKLKTRGAGEGYRRSQEEFENLRISVQGKQQSGDRMVSFPTRPNPSNELQIKWPKHSLSSFPNENIPKNDFPPFGRSFSLNEQSQGNQRTSFKGKGDVIKSYASSWLSDRVVTVEPPPASGDGNQVNSSATTPLKDSLYSPMVTPLKDGFYSPAASPLPNNARSEAAVFPANTFVMPKSPVQLSKFSKSNSSFSSPYSDSGQPTASFHLSTQSLFPKQQSSTPIHSSLITEDPSIIPPVTSPSTFNTTKYTSQTSLNSAKTLSPSLSPIQASAKPFDVKVIQTSAMNGSNSSHGSIPYHRSSSSGHSEVNGDVEENDMIVVTEVHSMSLVLGHFKNSNTPVTFALTNLEDLIEVDLDYVRILLLNRVFRAAFDYNSSKCYGTLYKRNESLWINMNLFILEETLDPLSVRLQRGSHSRPTYTVSELFSIRRKSRSYENFKLTKNIQEQDIISGQVPIKFDNLERKLAILHKWEDSGRIVLEFISLDEDAECSLRKSPKPLRPKVDGRTRVECFLRGFSDQEVEWTPSRISKMRDLLRVGSKVLVRIFERSGYTDPSIFSIDLRSLERCSFLTEILRREPSLCPQWKVEQVEMPSSGERVFVTCVRSLQQIYALPLKYLEPFGDMFTSMQEFYGKQGGSCFNALTQLRCLCGFKSAEDGSWYRGRVEALMDASKVLIYSVDFGNYETLPETNIRELPNSFRNLPLLSCYLKLSGMVSLNGTKHDLEARVLHKVFRYFPLKPKNQLSPGILLNPYENSPLVF